VAAKSEHVRPRAEAQVVEFEKLAEADALADKSLGMVADAEPVDPVAGPDAPAEGAGAFGGWRGWRVRRRARRGSRSPRVMVAVSGSLTRWQIRPDSCDLSAVTPGPGSAANRWPQTMR
jgi:hypothetical protein